MRTIKYYYTSNTLSCDCCSDAESLYDLYQDGRLIREGVYCGLYEDEDDLRKELAHLLPFDVDPDSQWFK